MPILILLVITLILYICKKIDRATHNSAYVKVTATKLNRLKRHLGEHSAFEAIDLAIDYTIDHTRPIEILEPRLSKLEQKNS